MKYEIEKVVVKFEPSNYKNIDIALADIKEKQMKVRLKMWKLLG